MKRAPLSERNAAILRALTHLPKDQRVAILRRADKGVIKSICECALNTLNGNVPLSSKDKRKLRRYATDLRKLSNRTSSLARKRKFIIQKGGGFLIPLLTAVATVLAGVLGGS